MCEPDIMPRETWSPRTRASEGPWPRFPQSGPSCHKQRNQNRDTHLSPDLCHHGPGLPGDSECPGSPIEHKKYLGESQGIFRELKIPNIKSFDSIVLGRTSIEIEINLFLGLY